MGLAGGDIEVAVYETIICFEYMQVGYYKHMVLISLYVVLLFMPGLLSASNRVVLKGNNSDVFLTKPNCTYVIRGAIDLGGKEIKMPNACSIKFKRNGKLINGTLVGNNTKLRGLKNKCIGIIIKREWLVPVIKDSYFDWTLLTDNQILDNLSEIQSDDIVNKIVLTKPQYVVSLDKKHLNGLSLKSNAVLEINSTINVAGNNLTLYKVISVSQDNIEISGGQIVGDVGKHTYIDGSTSQWGFGISINIASNVTISNIKISRCTGDGIYIGGGKGSYLGDYKEASKNIVLKNVISDDNRRQGVSITYADGVIIEDCEFSNTGKTESVSPGCGMDIEPNEGQAVRNVMVRNCQFLNNNKNLGVSIGGYRAEGDKCNVENIVLERCVVSGPLSVRTGSVTLKDCSMPSLSLYLAKMPQEKVYINRCQISGGSGISIRSVGKTTDSENIPVYTFKSCTLGMKQVLTRAMFSTINHSGKEVAEFNIEDCLISLPEGNQKYDVIVPYNSCTYSFNNCEFITNNRSIDMSNKMFKNCKTSVKR